MPARLGPEELRYIALFQDITGATVMDCIIDEEFDRVIYVVKAEDMGKAIGKRGSNARKLAELLKKNVEIIEYAESLEDMVKTLFKGVNITRMNLIEKNDKKILYINVPMEQKGRAIGRNGKNIKKARMILARLFDIDHVALS
ncbi:MAG: NusA-like transcription termination signal-binding factor [Desulfurococcales archaeon]|nr:NusA-like transcription termination signal-binding factor [Desulfurococcales archaeon]